MNEVYKINRVKNITEKIKEFFDCYKFIIDEEDSALNKNEFLSYSAFEKILSS